jgi:hypothetical protein
MRVLDATAENTFTPVESGSGIHRPDLGLVSVSTLVLLTIVTLWVSNQILPPSLMARLTENQTGIAVGASQVELIESRQWLGYVLSPVALGARLLLAALVVQGVGMAFANELRFGLALRAAVAGGFASLYGSWMSLLWIWKTGVSGLSLDVMGVVPGSVSAFFMPPEASRDILYRLAAQVSFTSILWLFLVALIIRGNRTYTWRSALLVAVVAWAVLATARVGLYAAFVGLAPG